MVPLAYGERESGDDCIIRIVGSQVLPQRSGNVWPVFLIGISSELERAHQIARPPPHQIQCRIEKSFEIHSDSSKLESAENLSVRSATKTVTQTFEVYLISRVEEPLQRRRGDGRLQ